MDALTRAHGIMKNAAKSAFDQASRAQGKPTDPDLQLYQTLGPQDLQNLMRKYGEPEVVRYITKMEAKRMGVKHA